MAQIIAKFGYLKGKSRGGYAKYIATREGVEKLDESLRDRPVTQSQQEFINKLLEDGWTVAQMNTQTVDVDPRLDGCLHKETLVSFVILEKNQ